MTLKEHGEEARRFLTHDCDVIMRDFYQIYFEYEGLLGHLRWRNPEQERPLHDLLNDLNQAIKRMVTDTNRALEMLQPETVAERDVAQPQPLIGDLATPLKIIIKRRESIQELLEKLSGLFAKYLEQVFGTRDIDGLGKEDKERRLGLQAAILRLRRDSEYFCMRYEKVMGIIEAHECHSEAKAASNGVVGAVSDFFHRLHGGKTMTARFRVAKKDVVLRILPRFTLRSRVAVEGESIPLAEHFERLLDDPRSRSLARMPIWNAQFQRLRKGVAERPRDIEEELTIFVRNTATAVLLDQQQFLHAGKTEIFIMVCDELFDEKGNAWLGCRIRSAPNEIFINIRVQELVPSFIDTLGGSGELGASKDSMAYRTLVHEFSHAHDHWTNTLSERDAWTASPVSDGAQAQPKSLLSIAEEIIGERPCYPAYAFFSMLYSFRLEGFARLNEKLLGRTDKLLHIQEIIPDFQTISEQMASFLASGVEVESSNTQYEKAKEQQLQYNYGLLCCFVILAGDLKENIRFLIGPQRIPASELGQHISSDRLMFIIRNEQVLKQEIAKLSLMNVERFFASFFSHQKELGIKGVTIPALRKLDSDARRQNHAILRKLGFDD